MTHFSTRGFAVLACVTVLGIPATARAQQPAQPPQPPPQESKEHVVRKGDTLWDLARSYLSDPFRWPMIYEANRRIVENPHRIFPAEKLVIPGLAPEAPVARATPKLLGTPYEDPAVVVVADAGAVAPNRSRFYEEPAAPREPTVLTTEVQRDAIVRPHEWVAAPWVAAPSSLGISGEIVNAVDPRNEENKIAQLFHPRDKVYVNARGRVGDRLLVVRVLDDVGGYGNVIKPMGVLRIDTVGAEASRAVVTHQFADMKVGDYVMPFPAIPQIPTTQPRQVSGGATGRIIDFLDDQPIYGITDIAFVDLGASRGVRVGDEIVAFVPNRRPDGDPPTLPAEPVAQLRVIKITNNTATVRVTHMRHSSLDSDMPVRVSRQQSQ